ncbi:hypothetical protein Tco_0735590 [Tanacetum coccineum]
MSKPRALGTLSVVASEVCFCVGLQKLTPEMVRELLEMPYAKPAILVMKVMSATGVLVAGAAIVTGIYLSSKK